MEKFEKIEFLLDNMFKTVTSQISERKGSLFHILLSTLSESLLKKLYIIIYTKRYILKNILKKIDDGDLL